MLIGYILSIVWVKLKSILSFIFHAICRALSRGCMYSASHVFSLVMIVRVHVLHLIIIIKSEVWSICDCLGLGHETMVCVIYPSVFLWSFFIVICRHNSRIEDLNDALINLLKLELSQLHTRKPYSLTNEMFTALYRFSYLEMLLALNPSCCAEGDQFLCSFHPYWE